MLLIAFGIALLVIVAGIKLLIHIQKETLGNFYKYVSWFVVTMGFLMLFFISCAGVCRLCFAKERMMEHKFKMMEEKHHEFFGGREEDGYERRGDYHGKMGRWEREEGCERNEMRGNYSEREECCERKKEECHKWKERNEEEAEVCPMKKEAEFKKDSVKKAKHSHPAR
jgi:hypothetical protein